MALKDLRVILVDQWIVRPDSTVVRDARNELAGCGADVSVTDLAGTGTVRESIPVLAESGGCLGQGCHWNFGSRYAFGGQKNV
jgi:hypothetical protein